MRWLRSFLLVMLVPLAGCSLSGRPATYEVDVKGPYQLDTGDVVRVLVYGDEALSKSYRVDDSGKVALPLVGPISVRGRTTETASARISAALANGFMRNPNVSVEVEQYRPFFIQGEIKTAGQFTYVYGMTVRAAISTAGGYTETADRGSALVYHRRGNEMVKSKVDLDFPIYPGDTIVILERWI